MREKKTGYKKSHETVPLKSGCLYLRAGMLKVAGTHEVELAWEPPKGDFTKYVLSGTTILVFTRNASV